MTAPPAGALEACLALLEKATPGEWWALGDNQGHPLGLEWTIEAPELAYEDYTGWIAGTHGGDGIATTGAVGGRADAEAIVAAVNYLRNNGPALLAALRLREWRPIVEAPKDGRRILVAAHGLIPYVARHETGEGWLDENSHYRDPIVWRPLEPPTADELARVLEEGE